MVGQHKVGCSGAEVATASRLTPFNLVVNRVASMIWELDRSQEVWIYFCYTIHKWASLDTVHKVIQLSSVEDGPS